MQEADTLLDNGCRERRDQKNLGWVVLFVTVASLAMTCNGIFISITGPTLQFLAVNTDSRINQVSVILAGRSVGILVGSVIFSSLSSCMKRSHHVWSLSVDSISLAAVLTVTPFLRSRALLVIVEAFGGILFGYFHAGLQGFYMKNWVGAASRTFIQITNFSFSLGAFLAPIVAKPFLEMEGRDHINATTCGKDVNYTNHIAETDTYDPLIWCFVTIGSYVTLVAVIFILLSLCNIEKKIFHNQKNDIEAAQERPMKKVWVLFILIVMYMFCTVANLMVFQTYIYSTAVCSALKMNVHKAALLNSLYWTGNIVGGVSGVLLSRYLKPNLMILMDIIGTSFSAIVMSIWGEENEMVMWIFTFVFGFTGATLLPSGMSWSNQVTNMSGKYMFIFMIGTTSGSSIMSQVAGTLFQKNAFSMVYVVTGTSISNILVFTLMFAYKRCVLE